MKKKISAFEFAIMEVADPEEAKKYEPKTKEEEAEERRERLRSLARQFVLKNPKP